MTKAQPSILSAMARSLLTHNEYKGAVLAIEREPLEMGDGRAYLGHFDTVEEAQAYLDDTDGKIIWSEIVTGDNAE